MSRREAAKEYSPWRKPWVAARNQAQPRRGERNGSLFAIGIRVQVKCTRFRRGRSYKCHLDSNGHPYSPDQIDFLAAYVIPTDTWYILPIEATNAQPDILLTPHNARSKYEKYKEAWHLLQR